MGLLQKAGWAHSMGFLKVLTVPADQSPAPMDSNTMPTPQAACLSSPASVMEISRDEFPSLATPTPATETKPRAKATKANKGKRRAKAGAHPTGPNTHL
jgi:hypothetical protein